MSPKALLLLAALPLCALPPLAEPALSPDGREIAFVSGGDLWTVPAAGGEARLLVSHPAVESRPLWSPDGRRLAFQSTRDGAPQIYLLTLADGRVDRLTWSGYAETLDAWSRDGQWLYFHTALTDLSSRTDIHRIPAAGGTPVPATADRYASEFHAAPAPDGARLLYAARGIGGTQWWRKGRSHIDESELWIAPLSDPGQATLISPGGAKQLWPQWEPDGKAVIYVSDRTGPQNLYRLPIGGKEQPLTTFTTGRVLYPSLSLDGKAIAFEHDFEIWLYTRGKAARVPITLRGAGITPSLSRQTLGGGFSQLALSPDGRKLAFIARGEVWAAGAKEGGEAVRLTRTPAAESEPTWSADSRQLAYLSERDGRRMVYLYDFATSRESALTTPEKLSSGPLFSPDGKSLLYLVDGRELHLLETLTRRDRVLATAPMQRAGALGRSYLWSPDSRWVVYAANGARNFRNLHAVPADGSAAPTQLTFLANAFLPNAAWSPDGRSLFYETFQRTEPGQIARLDLVSIPPSFREDSFTDLFAEAKKDPPKPTVSIQADGLRRRVHLLTLGLDAGDPIPSPDGKQLLFTAETAGQQNLYLYPLDPLARGPRIPRQLTATAGGKSSAHWSADSKTVYYLDNGTLQSVPVDTRAVKAIPVTAEYSSDFAETRRAVFEQAWSTLNYGFYDPQFHGADWNAIRATYAPVAEQTSNPEELRRVLNLMVGELNASHLGVSGPPAGASRTGRLGIDAVWENGRLRIRAVIPEAVAGLAVGEYIDAVNGTRLDPSVNLDQLLDNTAGKLVTLTVNGQARRVQPITAAAEKQLRYRAWVEDRRAYVARKSNGKLGYVHMPDMSADSLNRLYLDLDEENQSREGVIVDIRNNNGGFVNVYAIDVLARRNYLNMTPRGFSTNPARGSLGQRSLERPVALVTNQESLSDAEDFSEGFRALGLGKIIGEPTAGWIIYTSAATMVDGTTVRLPFIKITTTKGENMERNPRPVDIPVHRPMGESYRGADSQLDAAIAALTGTR